MLDSTKLVIYRTPLVVFFILAIIGTILYVPYNKNFNGGKFNLNSPHSGDGNNRTSKETRIFTIYTVLWFLSWFVAVVYMLWYWDPLWWRDIA